MEDTNHQVIHRPEIDLPQTCEVIETLIRTTSDRLNRDGAVVALSGGLDSAVTAMLTIRSLGAEKVHLINMPEVDSKSIHRKHAKQLSKHLGAPLVVKSIAPTLRAAGIYRLLPLSFIPGKKLRSAVVNFAKNYFKIESNNMLASRLNPGADTWVSKGAAYALAKHRIRMMMVYQYAEVHNLLVVGAANRTEWLTGTFSKWGVDHCADVMPLLHIYRSQLEQIAEFIGVPDYIRTKTADPDIMPGINDKGALLGNFNEVDDILYGIEQGTDSMLLIQTFGKDIVEHIQTLFELSKHMRESPYYLSSQISQTVK
jgi:NAD+ synthase